MSEFIVEVENETGARWMFRCDAEDADHAEEQALSATTVYRTVAVFERTR